MEVKIELFAGKNIQIENIYHTIHRKVICVVKNKLKEIRMREYMMNQTEFCDKVLNMNIRTYSPIEGNKVQGNIETILQIAKALNRKVEDIWLLE